MIEIWREYRLSQDLSHHVIGDSPAYPARFLEVQKFHAPGLAPVRDASGSYHITPNGSPAYAARHLRTFGFYEDRAAVHSAAGWHHIMPDGSALYPERYDWCGNFQDGRCPVRLRDSRYFHIKRDGAPAYDARYRYAGDFRDGCAVVQRDDGMHTHVDADGVPLHGRWFLDLDVFHKNHARARDAQGWHHVDARGQPLYDRRFQNVEPFYNGQSRVEGFDGSLSVIDETGATLIELRPPTDTPSPPMADKGMYGENRAESAPKSLPPSRGKVRMGVKSPPSTTLFSDTYPCQPSMGEGRDEGDFTALSSDMVGLWRTQTIAAAVELGAFEALPASAARLERQLHLPQSIGARLLRALAELGLVKRDDAGVYRVSERGAPLARAHPTSLADAAAHWGRESYAAWGGLAQTLRIGQPAFERIYGRNFFDWLADRPADLAAYHTAMSAYARHDYPSVVERMDLSGRAHVLDAGGGTGELACALLRANPSLSATVMDRPEVVENATVPDDLQDRCRFVAGDLFRPWPIRADAVILARILHDWNDAAAIKILSRARAAMPPDGDLYIVEMALDETAPSGGLLDLHMLVMTQGAERTPTHFARLLNAADFNLVDITKTKSVSSIIQAKPK